MSEIHVINESSTEANVRIKFWTKDYTVISAGEHGDVRFVNEEGTNVVQVEARSRKQWDECWVTMNVNETLVVYDSTERIGCRVK